jgi:uncharacterized membrane protein YdjX (TVP38/TMEM64 family)
MKTKHWVAIAIIAAGITAFLLRRKIYAWYARKVAGEKVAIVNDMAQEYVKQEITSLIGGGLE